MFLTLLSFPFISTKKRYIVLGMGAYRTITLKELEKELEKKQDLALDIEIKFLPEYFNLKKEMGITPQKWEEIPFKIMIYGYRDLNIPVYRFPKASLEEMDFKELKSVNILSRLEYLAKSFRVKTIKEVMNVIKSYLFLTDLREVEFIVIKNNYIDTSYLIIPFKMKIPYYKKGYLIWETF
jgi:hypothetical protein